MQFCTWRTSISASDFNVFLIFLFDLEFMQIDPKLTIKLLIFFNFTSDFIQFYPHSAAPFTYRFLAMNFFNLALNWPKNFNFLMILPLFWTNWLCKN
jgi:hypothetical protein